MPFKETPLFCPMGTCTKELHEKKAMKCAESNCCIWSSPSDMAPLYAIEIAKLWIKQNCKNAAVFQGHKMNNFKQSNDQKIIDNSVMTSGEEVVQCQQIKRVTASGEQMMQCQQIKDIGVGPSGKRVTWCQKIKDIAVMTSKEKVTRSHQIKDIGVMTSGEKVMQCQQIKDIGVVTSGKIVTWCDQIKDVGVMTSKEKVTKSQQIKDIGVMTSGEKDMQCEQIKDIGVMTSREKVTLCQQIKDIGVMTSRENVTQSHQDNDIGVMTSGEKVIQYMQKTFSDNNESHKIMAPDGPGGNGRLPLVAQVPPFSKTDHIVKSVNMTHPFQKCSESNKQLTVKENISFLVPVPSPFEDSDRQTVKQSDIYSTTTNRNSETREVVEMRNSSVSKCANISASDPILKNGINKHRFHENNSCDKKYSVTSDKTLFQKGKSCEKWCVNSHSVICNVMHRLPLEGSGKSSYSRLLISEGGLPHEKDESKKLCVPELLLEVNTKDTTQSSGNCGVSLTKPASVEQFDSIGETKDQYKITCCSVHQTEENNDLQGIHTTNMKVNTSDYYPHTDLDPPVNINSEMFCNRTSEITKRNDRMNVLESKGNSLEFTTTDHSFTNDVEVQNVAPWHQGPSQKINGYNTKTIMKSYDTVSTTKKLNGGHLENEFQAEAVVCGQRGIKKGKQKNSSLHFKKRKQKSDEGITMNGIRLTFTDIQAEDEHTQKFTKRRSLWSFIQNLLRTLDSSRKRVKQPVCKKSSTFLTVCFKKHKTRKLKRETHGLNEKQFITGTSGYDRRCNLAANGQSCNYSTETYSSTEKTPTSSSQENIDNNYKKHRLTHPALQNVCQDFTSNIEQTKSLHNHDKLKHSIIDNNQLKVDQRTKSYKPKRSQINNYSSSKANRQVHDPTRSKENKYYDQPQVPRKRIETVNSLKDCKDSDGMLNNNVPVPVLFQDETSPPKTDESNKNIVVMVAEVHSSNVMVNPDIVEELRQQRRDINSLKKLLGDKENKIRNTSHFKNTRKIKPHHMKGITSEFGMPIVPDYSKNIINFQTACETKKAFGETEQQLSEHILKQKCESLSLEDYFAFNSITYKNRGQTQDLTANHHTDICYDCADEYTWRNNTRHGHRRAEKKHLRYMIRYCRNYKMNLWNRILNFFR